MKIIKLVVVVVVVGLHSRAVVRILSVQVPCSPGLYIGTYTIEALSIYLDTPKLWRWFALENILQML